MSTFRKKNLGAVEAVQFTGTDPDTGAVQFSDVPTPTWIGSLMGPGEAVWPRDANHLAVLTRSHSTVIANRTDWIIRLADNSLHVVTDEHFQNEYEPGDARG